jgi:hypothetical protein
MEYKIGDLVQLRPDIPSNLYGTGGILGYFDDRRIARIINVGTHDNPDLPYPMIMVELYHRCSIYNAYHLNIQKL